MYFGTAYDFYRCTTVLLFITVPLAIWKLIDIMIWCVQHLRVSIS